MQILIIGAYFGNKGAQSMLFTTIAMIRKYYPKSEIIFGHNSAAPYLNEKFAFSEVYYNSSLFNFTENKIEIIAPNVSWCSLQDTVNAIKNSNLIIDISGFALGSKWGAASSLNYIKNIIIAKMFNVPIILMPQSFGPFNFGDNQKNLDAAIVDNLNYPVKIFAREYDGYLPLREKYHLSNVNLHPDLVLSAPPINLGDIFNEIPNIVVPKISGAESCVGVIPNLRSFDRSGNPWQTLQVYYEIVNFLLKCGKRVYLFRHSFEDIYPCTWLKMLFKDDERVVLMTNDFSCFEYDAFCKQFDFLIVGRFHGIVHAYKNNIPCIMIGWAEKYKELAQIMYQQKYIFNVSAPNLEIKKILEAISDMDENLNFNKKILAERLEQIRQVGTCFSVMLQLLKIFEGKELLP